MPTNDAYDVMIDGAGQHFNVSPALIKTVLHIESGGNPNAPRGAAGEIGPFQFMPKTAARLGLQDPTDMRQAIPAAAKLLSEGLDKTGSAAGAMGYYNSGRTDNFPDSTIGYIQRGMSMYPGMKITKRVQQETGDTRLDSTGGGDEDPYVQAGKQQYQQITGQQAPGDPRKEHKSNNIDISSDPYVDAGKEYFKSVTGRDPNDPNKNIPEPAQPDAAAATTPPGPQPEAVQQQATTATSQEQPGFGESLLQGGKQGVKDVVNQALKFSNWADNASPWLSALDNKMGWGADKRTQTMSDIQSGDQQYEQKFGDSVPATVGRAGGNIAATLPFGGVAGKAILGAGEAAGVAPWIARLAAGAAQGATGSGMTGQDPLIGAATGGAISGAANLAGPLATGLQKTAKAAASPLGQVVLGKIPSLIAGTGGGIYGGPLHAAAGAYMAKGVGDVLKGVAAKYGEEFAQKVADAVRQNPELINQLNIPTILTSANKAAGFQLEE